MKKTAVIVLGVFAFITGGQARAEWEYIGQPPAPAATEVAALTPPAASPYFIISRDDVEKAVADQIALQSADHKKVNATMDPTHAVTLHAADHPLKVSLQALQIDRKGHRWQAQAYIIGNRSTETIRPVSGRYETLVSVPVLTRQHNATDIIEASHIAMRDIPERQLRKDTVTSTEILIGKSPVRMISADRPIRAAEIGMPNVIKRGDTVEMSYTTEYMHIRDQGEALEDGAMGETIRVKNSKTGRAISARVERAGRVEVNSTL